MLTREECASLCKLTEEETAFIASSDHYPADIAAEFESYLVVVPGGHLYMSDVIKNDLAEAKEWGDIQRTAKLKQALQYFIDMYPTVTSAVHRGNDASNQS